MQKYDIDHAISPYEPSKQPNSQFLKIHKMEKQNDYDENYKLCVPYSKTPKVEEMIKKINIGPFNEKLDCPSSRRSQNERKLNSPSFGTTKYIISPRNNSNMTGFQARK